MDTADKLHHLASCCHKLAEYVVYVDVLDVADDVDADYLVADVVVNETDDAEFGYETANATHGKDYDDGKLREVADVLELIADDVVNDEVGNEVVALVARDVAVINYFEN